jgi:tetratricopeptide (TPR) repeat protein
MKIEEINNKSQTKSNDDRYAFDLESAETGETTDASLQILEANQHIQSGNLDAAAAICHRMLTVNAHQAEALHLLGVIALQAGENEKALALFQNALAIDPTHPLYHCSQGEALKIQGRLEESIACYHKALVLNPDVAEIHYDLGNTYHCQKAYADAIRCYQKALQLKPDFAQAYYNLANTYLDQRNLAAAISHYQRALVLDPAYADAYFNLGIAYFEANQMDDAIAAYRKALEFKPDMTAACYNMGLVLHRQKRLTAAVSCFQQAIQLNAGFPAAYNNMGVVLLEQKKHAQAMVCFQKAIDLKPDYTDAVYNLGKCLTDQGRYPDAIACYQKALQQNPGYHKACNNMGKICQDIGANQKAIFWFQKAVQIEPDNAEAQFNLATVYLLTENFQKGWKAYEWRFKRRAWKQTYPYQYDKPRWTGESFVGRQLFVHSEQGLGDIFQFVRYLPWVKALGGTVIFETRKELIGLFKDMPEIDELVTFTNAGQPAAEFDLVVPLASLPGIFETTLENLPAKVPYIFADREKCARWRARLTADGVKVGLVWAGTNTDPRRACPLGWLKSLSDITGVHLYGLQKGIAAEQIEVEGLPEGMQLTNLGQEFKDFTDTAAVIDNLDLVVSTDTSVAHLAGAMGKTVWVMLPYVADWRWFLHRDDSPWYPTMRLFRQPGPGNWNSVGRQITAELQRYTARLSNPSNPTD